MFHIYLCIFEDVIIIYATFFYHYCSPHLNCLRKCHQQSAGLSAVSVMGQCHPRAEYVLSSDNRGDCGMWDDTRGKNCRGSLRNDFCLLLISVLSLGTLCLLTALYIVLKIMILWNNLRKDCYDDIWCKDGSSALCKWCLKQKG